MSKRVSHMPKGVAHVLPICAVGCISLLLLLLGNNNNNNQRAVGGIKVDAEGVVNMAPAELRRQNADAMKKTIRSGGQEITTAVEMRMISLKSLNQAIEQSLKENHDSLPEEFRYLAGIQRVEHVFLYPEENDIVLAGPGEGWVVDDVGNVVGQSTGLPVVHLEDLIIALQSANNARKGYGISCSIDPTEEGRKRFLQYTSKLRGLTAAGIRGAEEAMGQQIVTVTGVPETSRYARVLVAADYKMKRLAMHLERTPVKSVPSFLTIAKQKGARNVNLMPRWWLACNYEPLSKSEDGLAWKINGPGVKAMTETEALQADGSVKGTGKTNPMAQAWADNMTKNYGELSKAAPIFGDLRNIMDLSVVAALIEKEKMLSKVNLKIPMLTTDASAAFIVKYHAPRTVPTQCSSMRIKNASLLTASGGVQVESWQVASNVKSDQGIKVQHKKAKPFGTTAWYWN